MPLSHNQYSTEVSHIEPMHMYNIMDLLDMHIALIGIYHIGYAGVSRIAFSPN